MDDYLFLFATATLIAGAGIFYACVDAQYTVYAVSGGMTITPARFIQEYENAITYSLIGEILCWTTIFSIKFSFLFYFRGLVNRIYAMQVWWWITLTVFIPIAAIMIPGAFIVCPHAGQSLLCKLNPTCMQIRPLTSCSVLLSQSWFPTS